MELDECLLQQLRKHRDLSSEQLALRAGVSEREIRKLESNPNCNPTRRTMLKLAVALEYPVQRIFYPNQDKYVPNTPLYESDVS